jgi:hypothetical protein
MMNKTYLRARRKRGKFKEKECLYKGTQKMHMSWTWWHKPVFSATWVHKVGGLLEPRSLRQAKLYIKKKKKPGMKYSKIVLCLLGYILWFP